MPKLPPGGIVSPIDPALLGQRTVVNWQGGQPVNVRTAWMGPGPAPDVNVIQDGLPTRTWDYPVLWNMRRTPNAGKAEESRGTDFGILRALADETHVRLVIETVKNQQCQKKWSYLVKATPGEGLNAVRKRALSDKRIEQVRAFFESPDRRHDWSDWLRLVLEEALVCDNLSLLQRAYEYNAMREPFSIEPIDGDTIQVLSDLTGRSPDPPDVAYEQWIKGVVFRQFTAPVDRSRADAVSILGARAASERIEELMYIPRNLRVKHFYGFGPVEQLLFYINLIMRRDMTKLAHYTDGNIPAGFIYMPENTSMQALVAYQNWLDVMLTGDPSQRSKLIASVATSRPVDWAQKDITTDRFDDDLIRLVCFCFDISPSSIIQHQNKSTSDNAKDQAEEDSTALTSWIGRLQNYIIRKWFGYSDIIAVEEQQMEKDAEKQKDIDVARLSVGLDQPNELRDRDGNERYPELEGVNGQMSPTLGFIPFPTQDETAASRERSIAGPVPPASLTTPDEDAADAPPNRIAAKTDDSAKSQVKKNSSRSGVPRSPRSRFAY